MSNYSATLGCVWNEKVVITMIKQIAHKSIRSKNELVSILGYGIKHDEILK